MTAPENLTALTTGEADIEDFGNLDLDDIRALLDGSLYAFCRVIMGYEDLIPTLHRELCEYIGRWGEPGHKRIMTQIPREFFKTSVGTRANALWQVCREPDLPVAIFNERQDNSCRWLKAIREVTMGSKIFQLLYKDLLPPGVVHGDTRSMPRWWKWSDQELQFQRGVIGVPEPSISAHGVEAATTGSHWPKMILDDLISVKHKLSDIEMERTREWVRNHVYLMRPAEEGMAYVNCTPWTYTDIYKDLLADFRYKLYRRSALEDEHGAPDIQGESIFPEKLSKDKLLVMYDRDNFTFHSQMMCNPRPGREQHFDLSWLRHCSVYGLSGDEPYISIDEASYDPNIAREDPDEPPPPKIVSLYQCSKAIFLDPAPSEKRDKRADMYARNGVVVEAIDPWGRRFVLESWAGREDYLTVIHKIFELGEKWGVDLCFVEEVNFSNVYRHWGSHEADRLHKYFRFSKVKPGKMLKDTRITSLIPAFRQGLYYFNRVPGSDKIGCGYNDDMVQELGEYPNGLTVDLADALAYDKHLRAPESPLQQMTRLTRNNGVYPYGTRDPLTGY